MKVIKKREIPIQTCSRCHCEFKLKYKDLKYDGYSNTKIMWECPLCKSKYYVKFEEEL